VNLTYEAACELFLKNVAQYHAPCGKALVISAFAFADERHSGDIRQTGEPFMVHPVNVANTLYAHGYTHAVDIAGALLHDTVEDTNTTIEEIEERFGPAVARVVDRLTHFRERESREEYYRKSVGSIRAARVKAADRNHNLQTILGIDEQWRRERQVDEAEEKILPAVAAHSPDLAETLRSSCEEARTLINATAAK